MNALRNGLFALCMFAACSDADPVDLGSGPIGTQGSGLVAFSGTWDGYAEGFAFRDDKDRVRLTIDAEGNGTIQVGDSAPAAVPAANVGYSPVYQPDPLNPGFSYPFQGATVESERLRVAVDSWGYFAPYCAELTPSPYSDGSFGCTPELTGNQRLNFVEDDMCFVAELMDDGMKETFGPELPGTRRACGAYTCERLCQCDAQSCRVQTKQKSANPSVRDDAGVQDAGFTIVPLNNYVNLDAALESNGAKLVGTIVLDGMRITVRMNRQ